MLWHIDKRKLKDLKPYKHNPRKITEKGKTDLRKSVDKFGLAEPIVINTDNTIIGGHARFYVLQEKGEKECDCYVPERELTKHEAKELNVRLNKNIAGEWDWDILANEFETDGLLEWGFDDKELQIETKDFENKEIDVDNLEEGLEHECPRCHFKFSI